MSSLPSGPTVIAAIGCRRRCRRTRRARAQHHLGDGARVVHRARVRHRADVRVAAGRRRGEAARDVFLVLLAGLAQVRVQVDEGRQEPAPRPSMTRARSERSGSRASGPDARDFSAFDQHVAVLVEGQSRIQGAHAFDHHQLDRLGHGGPDTMNQCRRRRVNTKREATAKSSAASAPVPRPEPPERGSRKTSRHHRRRRRHPRCCPRHRCRGWLPELPLAPPEPAAVAAGHRILDAELAAPDGFADALPLGRAETAGPASRIRREPDPEDRTDASPTRASTPLIARASELEALRELAGAHPQLVAVESEAADVTDSHAAHVPDALKIELGRGGAIQAKLVLGRPGGL